LASHKSLSHDDRVDTSSRVCLFHAWKVSSRLVPTDKSEQTTTTTIMN